MKKLFSVLTILMIIIALSLGSVPGLAASGGSSGGGSGSSGSGASDTVDFYTYSGEIATAYIKVVETSDINYGIEFNLEVTDVETLTVIATLYDESGNFLTDKFSEVYASGDFFTGKFGYNLHSEAETYTVKFQAETSDGQKVCDMQTVSALHEGADIHYGYIASTKNIAGINPDYQIEVCEIDGTTTTHKFATKVALNNNNPISASDITLSTLPKTFAKFELNSNNFIDRLNYYDAVSLDDTYSVFAAPSSAGKTIKAVYVTPNEEIKNNYNICTFLSDGILADVKIEKLTENNVCFFTEAECSDIKLMVWENLTTLKPILVSTDVTLNSAN